MYRHIRLDKNEPFYIGIGSSIKRAYEKSKYRRSNRWINIIGQTEYEVEILFENVSENFAKEKEKEFILIHGRLDKKEGPLCNMTDGGDGAIGQYQSKELRARRSKMMSGDKNPMKGKNHSEESRKKMSLKRKGHLHSLSKKVIDTETNIIYDCAKYVSEQFGIKYTTLICWLNGSRPNKTSFKYYYDEDK